MQKTRKIGSLCQPRKTGNKIKSVPSLLLSGVWMDNFNYPKGSEVIVSVNEDFILITKKKHLES